MNLLALLEDPDGPSARLRFDPYAHALSASGHRIERVALPPSGPRRWSVLSRALAFDVVFLQRRLLQPWESALLRARARRLVVDVDDAIWRRDRAPFESWTRRLRARALLRRADVVLAGSRTLTKELLALGIRSEHLPTPAPPADALRAPRRADHHPPTLIWSGQPSTWRYMRDLAPMWERIRRSLGAARLLVVGSGVDADRAFPGAQHRAWSAEAESAALAESDVGLAPLPDDPWSRGKCAARLLAYLSAGLPAIASPVGGQREVADEVGGVLLADGAESFATAALRLLSRPDERALLVATASANLSATRSVALLEPRFRAHLLGERRSAADRDGAAVAGPGRSE